MTQQVRFHRYKENRQKAGKVFCWLLACLLLLLPLRVARAAEYAFSWESDPAPGTEIALEEKVTHTLVIEQEIEGWSTLRVSLGEGVQYDQQSVYLVDASGTPKAEEHQLIYGNRGFVLLASALSMGDRLTFVMWVAPKEVPQDGQPETPWNTEPEVSVMLQLAQGEEPVEALETATFVYTFVPPPEQTPEQTAAPTEAPPPVAPEPPPGGLVLDRNAQIAITAVTFVLLVACIFLFVRLVRSRRANKTA